VGNSEAPEVSGASCW